MPDESSFFSRFTLKFVEVIAAGVATAVSGYLIAHLGGFLPTSTPAAVQAPVAIQAAPSSGGASGILPTQPAASADANAQRPAPAQDGKTPATEPVRTIVNAAPVPPPRKPVVIDTTVASKPNAVESFEARIRAALAKGGASRDAARPASADAPPHQVQPHQADIRPAPPAVAAQPRPADVPTGAIAAAPRAADIAPQPAPQTPILLSAPPTVEIKAMPVAPVEAPPPAQPAPSQTDAQADSPTPDSNFFSAFKKLPTLLRSDKPLPNDQAPRPPMPVGQ